MLKIGIIDSGIPPTYSYCVVEAKDFTGNATTIDQLGHGTAVTRIISHNLASNIVVARVFHDKLVCTPSLISDAIHWLISMKVNMINMSFGLRNDRSVLREACEQALRKNIVLVAAAPSQGDPVYPSNYNEIIKATGDARCKPNEISWLNSPQADFAGYSGKPHLGPAGASIGCASVTAAIAQIKMKYPHYNQAAIIETLKQRASHQGTQRDSSRIAAGYSHDK
tara:strand:- start:6705 stop:7376 length:672 start_codon:yes stop_codon:yes gene_type:complete